MISTTYFTETMHTYACINDISTYYDIILSFYIPPKKFKQEDKIHFYNKKIDKERKK